MKNKQATPKTTVADDFCSAPLFVQGSFKYTNKL